MTLHLLLEAKNNCFLLMYLTLIYPISMGTFLTFSYELLQNLC